MSDLSGRVALITGASTGIGRAIAVELARRGARVALNYPYERERANVEETRRLVLAAVAEGAVRRDRDARRGGMTTLTNETAGGVCSIVRADVSREAEIEAMFAEVADACGPIDILVNNAGVQIEEPASHETTAEHFDAVLDVNLRGAFLCAREFLRQSLETEPEPGRTRGTILNVSSVHQKIPRPHYLSYAVSKYGLQAITETLALEYADRGIRVVAIAPGATRTPIQSWLDDADATKVVEDHIPVGRIAEPEEIGRMAAFLVSDDARYVTGQTLYADGGLTLYADFQEPWSG
ncbi:MAG TPA: SDR family oxidoreductase [Rhodothermales bacterium]|nr:SDR family oxidoreductase [Rhodothermales bacterium]